MVLHGQAKKEVTRIEFNKPKSLLLPGTSLASLESLSMPLVHEVVLSADIQCAECQKRIADMMSRMNEPDSVVVNVLEKKVTLTCRYPGIVKLPSRQVPVIYRNPVSTMAMIKRFFCSSRRSKQNQIPKSNKGIPMREPEVEILLLCCMVMRLNIDCHGCYRKIRRILNMKSKFSINKCLYSRAIF